MNEPVNIGVGEAYPFLFAPKPNLDPIFQGQKIKKNMSKSGLSKKSKSFARKWALNNPYGRAAGLVNAARLGFAGAEKSSNHAGLRVFAVDFFSNFLTEKIA